METTSKDKEDKQDQLLLNKTYLLNKKISAGSFGTVYSGLNVKTKEEIAIKVEKNNEEEILSVLREAGLLSILQGLKGIPKLHWSGSKLDSDYMVIQLLAKDLGSYLKIYKKFTLKTVVNLGYQLISILENVHEKSVLHRDIKPENILMGRGEEGKTVYFVDFGISKLFRGFISF